MGSGIGIIEKKNVRFLVLMRKNFKLHFLLKCIYYLCRKSGNLYCLVDSVLINMHIPVFLCFSICGFWEFLFVWIFIGIVLVRKKWIRPWASAYKLHCFSYVCTIQKLILIIAGHGLIGSFERLCFLCRKILSAGSENASYISMLH